MSGRVISYQATRGNPTLLRSDPDVDNKQCGIASIEEVNRESGKWTTILFLNSDQSNQDRQLSMAPHEVHVYRVKLYAADRTP
jgi:hypothetical protein